MIKIPKKIHLIFLGKDKDYPSIFAACAERMKSLHPFWEVNIYNEDDADRLLLDHFPGLYKWYYSYVHFVQRVDILRYLVVYLHGGFYIDMDVFLQKSLEELRTFNIVLAEEKTISESERVAIDLKHRLRVANYMFGSVAYHPFWILMLKEAIKEAQRPINVENDILESTGPGLLTNLYHEYRDEFPGIALLRNMDRVCTTQGHNILSCHFGNYATHLHQGTWRWAGDPYRLKKVSNVDFIPCSKSELEEASKFTSSLKCSGERLSRPFILKHQEFWFDDHFPEFGTSVADTSKMKGKKVMLVTSNQINTHLLSKENTNILFSYRLDLVPDKKFVDGINQFFQLCIVTHDSVKNLFISSGVTSNIMVINPGFPRLKRNFNDDIDSPYFTLGISDENIETDDLEILLKACQHLKITKIPDIKLNVFTAKELNYNFSKELESLPIEFTHGEVSVDKLEHWFRDLNAYISPFVTKNFNKGPLQSQYMGIPTIVGSASIYQELIDSGFYNLINYPFTTVGDEPRNMEFHQLKLEEAIFEVYDNYEDATNKSIRGCSWIEDKWDIESAKLNVLRAINNL